MDKLDELELQARLLKDSGVTYAEAARLLLGKKAQRQKAKAGKPSHWEKLTRGLCNADLDDEEGKRGISHADFKKAECNRKKQRSAEAKFKRAQHSPAESKKVSADWRNRGGSTRGFFNQRAANKRAPVSIYGG